MAKRRWTNGYAQKHLDEAQQRYGLRFPPDLIELYLHRRPIGGYDWSVESPAIGKMLAWPFEALLFDIEQSGAWNTDWGPRPEDADGRSAILRQALARAPKLIPLSSHRFLPETPSKAGNPVFSMYGWDTIYYGADLTDYFNNEFNTPEAWRGGP